MTSLKYKVRVNLGIFTTTLKGEVVYSLLLSEENTIPNYLLYGSHQTVEDVIKKICLKHLDVDPYWLDVKLIGCANVETDDGLELYLNHGVFIPEDVEVTSGSWVTLTEYSQKKRDSLDKEYDKLLNSLTIIMR
jgi:hypothetical protein